MCRNRPALIFCKLSHRSTAPTMPWYRHVSASVLTVLSCHRFDSVIIPRCHEIVPTVPSYGSGVVPVREHACQGLCLSGVVPVREHACQGLCLSGVVPVRGCACQGLCLSGVVPVLEHACPGTCLSWNMPVLEHACPGTCLSWNMPVWNYSERDIILTMISF